MRTRRIRKRTRQSLEGILALGVVFSLLWPAAVAQAVPSCSFDDVTGIVSVTASHGEVPTVSRLGDAIALDGVACGTATVTNTDAIDMSFPDDPDTDLVVVDLAGGPLAPGATDEGDDSSEIEIDISGGDGSFDTLRIVGSSGPDAFVTSFLALNLNAAETVPDEDLTVDDQISLELIGGDGDDDLALDPFMGFARATVLAGEGDDHLVGRSGGDDVLDAGPGRDVADYSWGFEQHLVWEESGEAQFLAGSGDVIENLEVAILTDGGDSVTYVGDAIGETWLGESFDTVNVFDASPLVSPEDRIVHGGPGEFDWIEFHDSAFVELSPDTLGGNWPATYDGFEYLLGSSEDDRFLVDHRDDYPRIVGELGDDVIDLRSAVEGMNVTLGQDTFGPGRWLRAFEFEHVAGTAYADKLLGPREALDEFAVAFNGFGGNDLLRGGGRADVLRGGGGADTLLGLGGPDELSGAPGDDLLRGGSGLDELRGGPGDDVLLGGPGADACVGGLGVDRIDCER